MRRQRQRPLLEQLGKIRNLQHCRLLSSRCSFSVFAPNDEWIKRAAKFYMKYKKNTFVYTYTNVHTSSKLYKCISNSICFFVSFRWTVFEVHNKRQTKRHMHFKCIDARFWVLLMVYKTRAEICIMSASTVAARCYCERELFFLPIHYIYICGYAQSVGTSDR